jgi:hypothetical protein
MPDLSYKHGITSSGESIFSPLTIADKILIATLLLLSIFSYAMIKSTFPAGNYAIISVTNREVARIQLEGEAHQYYFQSAVGPIVVERKNGQVRVAKASCPNKICRKMGWINFSGGMIVCAPGKVLIQVGREKENKIDAFTR